MIAQILLLYKEKNKRIMNNIAIGMLEVLLQRRWYMLQ
jgi:hypothetical protein